MRARSATPPTAPSPALPHLDPPLSGTAAASPPARPGLVALFWDREWNRDAGRSLSRWRIDRFLRGLTAGGYLRGLAQYGVGPPRFLGAVPVPAACGSTAPQRVDPASIGALVTCVADAGVLPAAAPGGPDTLLDVMLPPSTTTDFGTPARCLGLDRSRPSGLVDYHGNAINATGLDQPFTVVAAGCALDNGRVPGVWPTPLAFFTWALSHEIDEALTDPWPGFGWMDRAIGGEGEVADLCEPFGPRVPQPSRPVALPAGTVTPYWSNRAGHCVAGGDRDQRYGERGTAPPHDPAALRQPPRAPLQPAPAPSPSTLPPHPAPATPRPAPAPAP